MYRVEYTRNAEKELNRLPTRIRNTIEAKIAMVAKNPYAPNNNIKVLAGGEGYRLRVGDYRVVYYLDDGALIIEIVRVRHRKEAYS